MKGIINTIIYKFICIDRNVNFRVHEIHRKCVLGIKHIKLIVEGKYNLSYIMQLITVKVRM